MNYRVACSLLVFGFIALLPMRARAIVEPSPAPPPAAIINAEHPETFDPAAATRAWLDTVPADKKAKSDAYFEGGYWLILWDFLLSSAICVFFLATGLSARIRNFAERMTRFKAMQVAVYAVFFVLIVAVLSFPLTYYAQFSREHAYGLANQTFGPWFKEQLIDLAINVVGLPIFLIVLYAVFRGAPRQWWVWGAVVTIIFIAVLNILAPVFIAPLFNKYEPLTDPTIRDPILALARANQIPVTDVYQFDASVQTSRVSANVSGFLNTTRISLNDNLLKQCSLPEIRYVMSHEMGHYVLNHAMKNVVAFSVLAFLMFFFLRLSFGWAVQKWGAGWDVRGIGDPAGLPLIVLLVGLLSFLGTPANNTITRTMEIEADAFGLNASRESDGMAQAALKLGTYRKLDPGPWEERIFFDHPSGRARIRAAMDWKAAQLPCGDVKK